MHKSHSYSKITNIFCAALMAIALSACGGESSEITAPEKATNQIRMAKLIPLADPVESPDSTQEIEFWNEVISQVKKLDLTITAEECRVQSGGELETQYAFTGKGYFHVLALGEDEAPQLQVLGYSRFEPIYPNWIQTSCLPGTVLTK